ncbi:hypothetical protein MPL1032_230255 [Mesorhizobium plurifarium]|uniref:Uncharacterized protein n=1 Tax=Mesorhizobium plurifarium TaxID=69974 RepID=A0A0K2VZX0_MESPL|nr:hypothetical protein MPL1032_230255 [Mesorhizobium plurifarium]
MNKGGASAPPFLFGEGGEPALSPRLYTGRNVRQDNEGQRRRREVFVSDPMRVFGIHPRPPRRPSSALRAPSPR